MKGMNSKRLCTQTWLLSVHPMGARPTACHSKWETGASSVIHSPFFSPGQEQDAEATGEPPAMPSQPLVGAPLGFGIISSTPVPNLPSQLHPYHPLPPAIRARQYPVHRGATSCPSPISNFVAWIKGDQNSKGRRTVPDDPIALVAVLCLTCMLRQQFQMLDVTERGSTLFIQVLGTNPPPFPMLSRKVKGTETAGG